MTQELFPVDYVHQLEQQVNVMAKEIERLNQIVTLLTHKQFGQKKETLMPSNQLSLFDDPVQKKTEENVKPEEENQDEKPKRRKKSVGRKKLILDQFPQHDVHHTLEDPTCQDCHHKLKHIGPVLLRRELEFIPAVLRCVNHFQYSYKCEPCSCQSETDQFVKTTVPKDPIPNSFGSASLVAETIYQKYEMKVPAYRQEGHWAQLRLPLKRTTICQWHISVCEAYLRHLYDRLHEELIGQDILHIDETTFRVLESTKKQTYYWLLQSSKHSEKEIVYYAHQDGRGQAMFEPLIEGYQGYIQCDMYSVYRQREVAEEHITLAGCWAHVRRKFYDAQMGVPDDTIPRRVVELIDQLFKKEREWAHLSIHDRHQQRKKVLKPMMDRLYTFLDQIQANVSPQGLLNKALTYAQNHRTHFYTLLNDGRLELSNNAAERSIKTLVMGRRNQLFAQSFAGADAGAILLTLIETAKRHQLNGKAYIQYLLTHLPNEDCLPNTDWDAYLPWSEAVQTACHQTIFQDTLN